MQEDPRAPTKGVAALADLPLRRGKWTTDEQNYSELLIQRVGRRLFLADPRFPRRAVRTPFERRGRRYFLAGVVPDCVDGTTLRAFLSQRLHCAPMRITKKFAGATLGKSIEERATVHMLLNFSQDVRACPVVPRREGPRTDATQRCGALTRARATTRSSPSW